MTLTLILTLDHNLHCLEIDNENQSLYKTCWFLSEEDIIKTTSQKKDALSEELESNESVKPRLSTMIQMGNTVEIYGLKNNNRVFIVDTMGNISSYELPWKGKISMPRRYQVLKSGNDRLIRSYELPANDFALVRDKIYGETVNSTAVEGDIDECFTGLGCFFTWTATKNSDSIHYLDERNGKNTFRLLEKYDLTGRYKTSGLVTERVNFTSSQDQSHALYSVNNSLYLIQKNTEPNSMDIEPFNVKEINAVLPPFSLFTGILSSGPDNYICTFTTGDIDNIAFGLQNVPSVNILFVTIKEKKISTHISKTTYPVGLFTQIRYTSRGPYRINHDAFCFASGRKFYICSPIDGRIIYEEKFSFSAHDLLISDKTIVYQTSNHCELFALTIK